MISFIFIVFAQFFCTHAGTLPPIQQAEEALVISLLQGYNKFIRPENTVSVRITTEIRQIVSIDEKQQIMTSSSFISQAWRDERLSWTPSPSNFDISVLMIPVKSIWIPDTMVLNSADSSGYFTISDYALASVNWFGEVYMILPALAIKTRCNLYVQRFPFDAQMCSIDLTSWSQGSDRIVYTENGSFTFDASVYIQHPLWKLNRIEMTASSATDRVPFDDDKNDIISIEFYLKRKPLFFMVNGIFACLVLNFVTLLSFALPFGVQIGLCS